MTQVPAGPWRPAREGHGRAIASHGLGLPRAVALGSWGVTEGLGDLDELLGIVALAKPVDEELGSDHPLGVEHQGAGVGDPYVLVLEAVGADRGAALVRQQGKGDRLLGGVTGQSLDRVVADGDEGEAGGSKLGEGGLQLDQLLLAKGSPVGGAKEDQGHRALAQPLVEATDLPGLILQGEEQRLLPDLEARALVGKGGRLGRWRCGVTGPLGRGVGTGRGLGGRSRRRPFVRWGAGRRRGRTTTRRQRKGQDDGPGPHTSTIHRAELLATLLATLLVMRRAGRSPRRRASAGSSRIASKLPTVRLDSIGWRIDALGSIS